MLKSPKRKGTRAEHRAIRILKAAGYWCMKAPASLGAFDVVAIGPTDLRLIQVKSGEARLSPLEREQMTLFQGASWMVKEYWRFPDYCRAPLIERIP